jgi:hypothetical protein
MIPIQKKFVQQFRSVQRLVWIQRGFRWLLRSFWSSALVFLLTWVFHHFFGWFPGLWLRLGLSFAAGMVPLVVVFLSRPDAHDLAWRMDRRLGLQERLSTAWEVAVQERPVNPLEESLVQDASQSLPEIHLQVLRHGWGAARDFLILGLVLVALVVMLVLTFPLPELPTIPFPGSGDGVVPGLGGEPSAEEIFPGNVPGMPESGEGSGETDVPEGLAEIFEEMAQDLAGDPATQSLAEALDAGDLESAADALEALADQLEQLPEDTRQNLADSFAETVPDLQASGYPDLAEAFQDSADSLAGESATRSQDMKTLADALRGLGDDAPPEAEPTPDPATPEPVERLGGEGQSFELPPGQAPDSDLLVPAESPGDEQAEGQPPTGGTYENEEVIDTILVPYTYPWYWQDLISDYFTP